MSDGKMIVRTSAGLRDVLFDELEDLKAGNSNPARARSVAMLANSLLQSVAVDIEYHKYVSDISAKHSGAKLGTIEMGRQTPLSGREDTDTQLGVSL
jgi:hypothetical protein